MSDTETLAADRRPPGRPLREHERKRIPLPSGDELWPREEIAAVLDINPRTVQRMRLPTLFIGNVAYHPYQESLRIVASRIRRPGQPSAKRRGRAR